METLNLAWVTDPDNADHLTRSTERTALKTLCGRTGFIYTMGDSSRIWNATCKQCAKKAA